MTESTNEYKKRIEEIKQSIENEPYMAKMREDIAEGISKTGIRQATVEEQFQAVLDETTGKDVISAPELIAARNGKSNLKTRLDEEHAQVTSQLQQTEQELSSQLAHKANQTELNKKRDKSVLITMNDVSQDVRTAMTGGSVAVLGTGAVIEENIVDDQVTHRKALFVKDEHNIWVEPSDYVYTSPQTGTWQSKTFEFRDFEVGDTLTLFIESVSGNSDDTFAQFISYRADGTAVKANNFKTSLGTKSASLPVTVEVAKINVILFAAQTTTITGGTEVRWKNIRLIKNADLNYKLDSDIKITRDNLKDVTINAEETSFFTPDYNLYDTNTITVGSNINQNTGAIGSDPNTALSDYISVKPNTQYYKKYYGGVAYFNENKEFISGEDKGTADALYTTPKGCVYIRLTVIGSANFYREIFSLSSADHTFYMPAGTKFIKSKYIDVRQFNGWYGKKFTSFGHSLVGMNKWQPHIASYFGMTHVNCGIGGSTVAGTDGTTGSKPLWTDERINAIPADSNLIIILSGLNDYETARDRMGTIDNDTDTETFYGAYQTTLNKLYARCPNARVVLMVDCYRLPQQGIDQKVEEATREAIREIAYKYGYPLIDSREFGFNILNHSVFYQDPVHPNDVGGKRMADVSIGRLKDLSPYYSTVI